MFSRRRGFSHQLVGSAGQRPSLTGLLGSVTARQYSGNSGGLSRSFPLYCACAAPHRLSVGQHIAAVARLCAVRPDLKAEWLKEKNEPALAWAVAKTGDRTPNIHWRCQVCEHEYMCTIDDRVHNEQGCPQCAGKLLGDALEVGEGETTTGSTSLHHVQSQQSHPSPSSLGEDSAIAEQFACAVLDFLKDIEAKGRSEHAPLDAMSVRWLQQAQQSIRDALASLQQSPESTSVSDGRGLSEGERQELREMTQVAPASATTAPESQALPKRREGVVRSPAGLLSLKCQVILERLLLASPVNATKGVSEAHSLLASLKRCPRYPVSVQRSVSGPKTTSSSRTVAPTAGAPTGSSVKKPPKPPSFTAAVPVADDRRSQQFNQQDRRSGGGGYRKEAGGGGGDGGGSGSRRSDRRGPEGGGGDGSSERPRQRRDYRDGQGYQGDSSRRGERQEYRQGSTGSNYERRGQGGGGGGGRNSGNYPHRSQQQQRDGGSERRVLRRSHPDEEPQHRPSPSPSPTSKGTATGKSGGALGDAQKSTGPRVLSRRK